MSPDVTIPQLIRLMANRELAEHFPKRRADAAAKSCSASSGSGRRGVLHDVSLTVHRGEVVGVAGLLGAGRTELARAIIGADARDGGRIFINGAEVPMRHPAHAIAAAASASCPKTARRRAWCRRCRSCDNIALPNRSRAGRAPASCEAAREREARRRLGRRICGSRRPASAQRGRAA